MMNLFSYVTKLCLELVSDIEIVSTLISYNHFQFCQDFIMRKCIIR